MPLSETWVDFLAGWCSGAAAVVVCQPMDTLLTRLQAQTSTSIRPQPLIQQFGIASLWRGSTAMISAVPLQNALLMGGYGMGKSWSFEKDTANVTKNHHNLLPIFMGGCAGGIAQSFLMSPVELIKVQQQVVGSLPVVLKPTTIAFRGLTATLWRDGIPHGVWFVSYEWCKTNMTEEYRGTEGGVVVPLTSGAFAATVAWVCILGIESIGLDQSDL